ncbi:hypothetical protein [Peterkaempfera bronchialis]|uniref:hypothetical protein n=1 Tax=Peterkaempfera bronchialis TaxID=2126346 RepID=UPI003C2F5946
MLPRHRSALWAARLAALSWAADQINQASQAWDELSDSLCDESGWPRDAEGYGWRQAARDVAAWEGLEVFLDHGTAVLAAVQASDLGWFPSEFPDGLHLLDRLGEALTGAEQVRREWDTVFGFLRSKDPTLAAPVLMLHAAHARGAEGWSYATEAAAALPALLAAADPISAQQAARHSAAARTRAALARTPSTARIPPVPSSAPVSASAERTSHRGR